MKKKNRKFVVIIYRISFETLRVRRCDQNVIYSQNTKEIMVDDDIY